MAFIPTIAVTFVAYASASLLWSLDPQYGLVLLASLTAGFFIGREVGSLRWLWGGVCILLGANLALCSILTNGLAGNPNYFGCALALGLVAAYIYRFWYFIPIGIAGLAHTQSRTAIIAATLTFLFALPWRWKLGAIATGAGCLFVAYLFRGGSVGESMWQRMGIWEDTINHLTIFGTGFGSYADAYKAWPKHTNMTLTLTNHAYNDYLELIFELGLGAIPLWLMLILLLEVDRPERLIIACFLLLSLTYFPLYIPIFGQLLAITLGHLSRSYYGTVQTTRPALSELPR